VEGADIQIRTDHESLKTYRTKKDVTKRLLRFMNDVEHYNPLYIVPDDYKKYLMLCQGC
jgi:hypothetical protein